MRVLLHACCGPCAAGAVERLERPVLFFYNPNVHPAEEYLRRLEAARELARRLGLELIEGPYEPERWWEAVRGLEGEPEGGRRCAVCFELRLRRTALLARQGGFEAFTTTLTVSPHKDARVIHAIGRRLAEEVGVRFLAEDFKKRDGFKRSCEISRAYGLYRQRYCGCALSLR